MLARTLRLLETTSSPRPISSVDLDVSVVRRARRSRTRGRAELALDRGGQLVGVAVDDVVEAVVPEAEDLHERRCCVRCFAQLLGEVEDALDVVVVDVADHQQVDVSGSLLAEPRAFLICSSRGFRCGP